MRHWFTHPGAPAVSSPDDEPSDLESPLTIASRSCCCPAQPVVRVVMPPAPDRPHRVDLLLCGHHYRSSRPILEAAGAAAYNKDGALILAGVRDQPPARREPAVAART